jgi:hypothetical protein
MIESQSLPSWEAIFQQVGEPAPRRRRARCPIHGGDSPTSLSLNEEKGVYFCHVCHASGDKVDFVRQVQGTDFKRALAFLGIKGPCKPPRPDPEIVSQREALESVREWCMQTGRRLRDQYLMRRRIAHYAREKLAADPESALGWQLLRIASDDETKIEFLLDEIDLCRTDAERLHAWRCYRDDF